jgi:integrase
MHILPRFGDFYLDAIMPKDVARWLAEKSHSAAPGTVNGFLRVMRTICRDAMADHDLPRDPCLRVRAPKTRVYGDENPNLLSAEELAILLEKARQLVPQWYPLYATLALTGLRLGEAQALKWSDIDEKAGVIRVRRSQWKGMVSETKTGTIRSVPLVPELAEILREHRQRLLLSQNKGLQVGWMFPSSNGRLMKQNVARWPLDRCLKEAGLPPITLHGLRRTFNNLARQVTSGEVVRAITGHVTQSMTEHYSHIGAGEKRAAVASIVALMKGSSSKSGGSSGGSEALAAEASAKT